MVAEAVVFEVFNDIRDWFSMGDGAWNKAFDRDAALDAGKPQEKIDTRAERSNRARADLVRFDQLRADQLKMNDMYAGGKLIFNQRLHSGNCMYYTMLAGFFLKRLGVDLQEVYLGSIMPPGGHAFCAVGEVYWREWATVAAMAVHPADPKACWVIDGWLNVCCESRDYPALAQATLNKWVAVGKRVWWDGLNGDKPGWSETGTAYSGCFLNAPLRFHGFGAQRGVRF